MNFIKTFVFAFAIIIFPCHAISKEMSDYEIKSFRNSFLGINKNKFLDLKDLQQKSKEDLRYKVLLWHQLANSKSPKTFNDIFDFIDENPDFPKKYLLQEQAEKLIHDKIDTEILEDWFDENPPQTIEGLKSYIKLLNDNDKKEYIKEFWEKADLTSIEERNFYNNFKDQLNEQDLINRIDFLLWNGDIANANQLIKYVPNDYKLLFNARIALRKNYRSVTKAIKAVPENLKNDEGLIYERARWRRKRKLYNEAIELINSEHAHKSHPEKWWQERLILVRKLMEQRNYQRAYDLAIKGDNSSDLILAENQWLSGWIAYRFLNRPDIALGHFLTMRESVGSFISKARGDYWIARCYEEVNDLPRAWSYYKDASQYTTTFYGQKAAQRAEIKITDIFQHETDVSNWQYNRYKKTELANVIKFLSDLNLKGTMNSFVLRAFIEAKDDNDDEDVVSLVKYMREIGHDNMAVMLTRRARTAGIDVGAAGYPILTHIKYPKDADKALLHAVMRQESGFDPKAKSSAGARGLMQIMPATARNLSQWKRLRYSLKRLTSDINYNVTLGEYYLWRLLRQHKGSYIQTFAAYNAGAGNVRKWNRAFAKHQAKTKLDEIDWIESIPYDETRNYVQRVEENYFIYKHIINQKSKLE